MIETLLVDDSAIVRAHLSRLLSARGHGVVAVDDAESALVQCQVRQFQLIVLPAVRGYSTAARVAQKMLDALGETPHVRNLALVISGSIGIALCPSDADNREGLLGLADGAMYAAKSAG